MYNKGDKMISETAIQFISFALISVSIFVSVIFIGGAIGVVLHFLSKWGKRDE